MLLVLTFCLILVTRVVGEMVPLKVIDELPSTGYNNLQHLDTKTDDSMMLRMKPSNFSGPQHLKEWIGKCFKHRDSKYEYMLCPFHNITQEDVQAYYDPYKGILGVWSDWEIRDNQFRAMNMVEGSPCANGTHRSTKIILSCGKEAELVSIEEPQKCRYEAVFRSPEVCGVNSLVVYPRLAGHLRARWDQAERDHFLGYTTLKGHNKELERIYMDAGLVLSSEARTTLMKKASVEQSQNCQTDLEALRQRVTQLEEELRTKEEIIRGFQEGRAYL